MSAEREWAINKRTPTLVYDVSTHEAVCTVAADDLATLGFQESSCDKKEQAARARLIAAAPDLLAALKRLEDEGLLRILIDMDAAREDGEPPVAEEAVKAARAALSQAKGGK